jgi:hypothetical protein
MMKAVRFNRFGGPEVLEIVELPDPHPDPGQVRIAVRAAGVNPSDWKKRKGSMGGELPQTMGHEAAGVVDELGEGVADVAVGDRVFGFSAEGAAQAELAVLSSYAPIPPSLDFPDAAALPAAIETATRALDQLGVGTDSTLLINGAFSNRQASDLLSAQRYRDFERRAVANQWHVASTGTPLGEEVVMTGDAIRGYRLAAPSTSPPGRGSPTGSSASSLIRAATSACWTRSIQDVRRWSSSTNGTSSASASRPATDL